MKNEIFAIAAIFAFFLLAGCLQTHGVPSGLQSCKTLCEKEGGMFNYCGPGGDECALPPGCYCPETGRTRCPILEMRKGCAKLSEKQLECKKLCDKSDAGFSYEYCDTGGKCIGKDACICSGIEITCEMAIKQGGCRLNMSNASTSPSFWYFAYGSNLNFAGMQSRVGYWPEVRKATLPNYMRTFAGAADIRPNSSSLVYGAIYLLNESQMQSLDIYEGAPTVYRRINVTVISNNETLPAVAYQYVQERPFSPPSEAYLNTIIEGMRDNGYGEYEIGLLLIEARKNST